MVRPDESTPLVPKGFGAPRFLEHSQDKFLANEDENAYVQLEVFGDPPPTVTWMKGNVDLATLDRFQSWTCGKKGFVFLGVECAQKEDEGIYKCVIVNRFGRREHKFKLFIARSWQSRPAPPKKEVPIYWSEIPRSKFIKEGHKETVFFTAKLTVANKTGVWSFNGQECKNGDKYEISSGGGNFTIGIKNPLHADTGCYRCSLVGADLSCETYLDVQLPDPEYSFLRPLDGRYHGYTGRPLRLTCLASPDAKIAWFKDLKQVKSDNNIKITSDQGEHMLAIESLSLPHAGYYECRITRFGKEGADFCATDVDVEEFPHKFSRKLGSNMEIVERNDLVLQVCTEEKDAEVKWFKDNKQIQLERKRHQRLHMIHNEFTHQLKIERACVNDTGVYKAATNVDSTEINVVVEEYPFMLSEKLASQVSVMEGGRLTLEVKVVDEEADVEWCLNGIKLETSRSRSSRLQTTSYGHTRTLQIKRAEASDSGILSARTNKDISQTKLQVKCHNSFLERLPDIIEVPHNSKVEFKVKVRDVFAPVYFSIDRLPIELEDGSIEQEDDGLGNHKLIIYKVQTTDAGLLCCKTPSNRGEEMLQSKCIMNVTQGESPPVLGPADPVSCVAILHSFSERMNSYIHKEQCRLVIPYKIEGTRMSTLDILVEKDGEPVEVGNEIQLRVQTDKIIIDVINPQRIYSGLYKVTMSNEQGSGSIEIPVSIMDIPSPPKAAWVDEVFKESVTVYWKEPTDDGGCEIKHYVVECLDVTMGNLWVSLAMTDSGEPRSIQARNLIEGHRYMFRVAAANKVGQSEPCEVRGVTLVRDPWDCPGECGRCTVIDWMPTFADLTWTQPFTDGGAPIISYIIQLKEKSMREWIDSIEIPVEELEIDGNVIKGRCENLVEEYEYMFRVLAVNKGGRGHPGPPSQSVIAMYKNIPPSIKEGNIRDLKIKEGRSIRFDVWIAGEPAPTIEWLRNDEKIVPDEKTSINVYSKNASVYTLKNVVLSIPKALEEDHSGVYKLRLKNESGVFESMADINIEPPPGKQKKSKPKEEKKKEKEEEDEEKDQQQVQPEILRKLSTEGKEEDKDSGLKIGEESLPDSEESVWTEYTESSEEQELDLTGTAVTTPVANDSLTDEQKENAYNSKHHSNSTLKSKSDKEIIAEVSDDEGVQGVEQSDDHSSDGEFVIDTNIIETDNQEVQSSYKTPQNTSDSQSYNEHFDINNDVSNNTDHEQYKICNNIVSNKNMDDHENSFNNDNAQNTEGEENTDYYENNDLSNNATFNYNSFNNCESYQSNDFTENESNDNDYSSNIYNSYNNALHNNESSEIDNTENKTATDHDNTKMNYCNGDYRNNGISNQSSYSDNNSDNYEENSDYITARNNSNENSNVDNNNYCYYNNKLDDSNQDNTDTERFNGTSNGFSTSYTGGSCYGGSSMESNTEVDGKEPEQSEEEKRNIMERQKREEKRKLEEKAKEDRRLAKEKQRQEELDRLEALVREEERLKREVALERERKRQEELAEQARIKEEKEKEEQRKKEAKIKNEAELKLQQENLNKRLEHLGFIKSSKAAVFDYTNSDGVLISLLDQMNRDDQNFKVWDREDYSFLRWYMTRQMEAYIMKEKELPFVNLIEGDKLEYIERITEDYVHLDEIFLNAAASVFNKDIIIIPSDEKEEVRVLYGGAGTTKGKGSPLYLGCVGPIGETIPVQYYSIMQDQNSKVKFVYSDSTIDRRISVIANGELIPSSPKIKLKDDRKRSWKRMDSYTGGNSKDLDNMINSIMLEENMDELFDRLDSCEDDLEEDENVESINSLDAICDNFTEGDNNKSEWHESVPYATHVSENNEEDQNTLEKENEIQECLTTSESYSPFENSCENNNTETVNNEEWSCESDSSSSIHDENIKVQEDEEVPAHQNQ